MPIVITIPDAHPAYASFGRFAESLDYVQLISVTTAHGTDGMCLYDLVILSHQRKPLPSKPASEAIHAERR